MLAWLQLVRLPTVFTAVADTLMAVVVVSGAAVPATGTVAVLFATIGLYWAGMVLNDYFDREVDARERPTRPLPSGRVSPNAALVFAIVLCAIGIAAAATASWQIGNAWCVVLATLLTATIVAYNSWLKHTPHGPWVMGACRALNVLMVMTGVTTFADPSQVPWLIPLGLLGYIAGVTLFARDEAGTPQRGPLIVAALIAAAGLFVLAWSRPQPPAPLPFTLTTPRYAMLWVVVALFAARRFVAAILQPSQRTVVSAVKHALLSLILIDGALALSAGGPYWAFAILALMAPAMLLSQWIRMT